MGWYILQIVIVFGLLFANIHYQWIDEPWLGFALSWGSAYIVTKLLSWLFFLVALLRGDPAYGGYTHSDAARLIRAGRHLRQTREQALRTRVRDDVRDGVKVLSSLPLRPKIVGLPRPGAGRQNGLRRITKR
jgi:hypothetical protein